jgi:hypothetical protein
MSLTYSHAFDCSLVISFFPLHVCPLSSIDYVDVQNIVTFGCRRSRPSLSTMIFEAH